MIDAEVTRGTCRTVSGETVGTGWLATSTHLVTARHNVVDAIASGAPVEVHFELNGVAEVVLATVVAEDEAIDTCVLQLPREIAAAPLPLDTSVPLEGGRFSAFGFPVAKLSLGHRLEGTISRVHTSPKFVMDLDLQIDTPAGLTDYRGISGAALILNGRCCGMLRVGIDRSLGALSIGRLAAFLRKHSIPIDGPPDGDEPELRLASRGEFKRAFDSLVSTVAGGYAFLEGAHGIGKSTFCERYRPSMPGLEYFATYSFTATHNGSNATHLAQPEVFSSWLSAQVSSLLTGAPGRVSNNGYSGLVGEVEGLLDALARHYSSKQKVGVIFLDGLDEVAKLAAITLERFVGLLPPRIQPGLVFVISAPSYANLSAALGARIGANSCITMPPLERQATVRFCEVVLSPERLTAQTIHIICDRAQGHALYLRYLIDLANGGADDEQLTAMPLIEGRIRNYYDTLWRQLIGDAEAVNLLAIVARLRWGIPIDQLVQILNDAERAVMITTLTRIQHLLLRRDETTIYHASFAEFLIEKTAVREKDIQLRLATYCTTHPESSYGIRNNVYHGLKAGSEEFAQIVARCDQDWADRCVALGADPDTLLGDVNDALAAAAEHGSLVDVVRLLLLGQRLQFRYDTLFAQAADLAADALIALGRTQEALHHVVRYGYLIVPVDEALRLAHQLTEFGEPEAARDILDKAEAVIDSGLRQRELTGGEFLELVEQRQLLLVLRLRGGDETAAPRLLKLAAWSRHVVDDNFDDEQVRVALAVESVSSYFASTASLSGRYADQARLRAMGFPSTDETSKILLLLLAKYHRNCIQFNLRHDRSVLNRIFADVQEVLDEQGLGSISPDLDLVDALVSLGAPLALVHGLASAIAGDLAPIQFIAADNVSIDSASFINGMARWRLASLLNKDLPCPASAATGVAGWRDCVVAISTTLAWCDGAGKRAKEAGDQSALQSTWALLEQHVIGRLRFTLAERVKWEDSYAIPETVYPEIYEYLAELVVGVFPDKLIDLLSFLENQFSVQCGLYSEGFRSVLEKVLRPVTCLPLDAEVEGRAFALLQRSRKFVQSQVKNRHELVPELLAMIPLFVRLNASEEADRIYRTVLASSMGPSWYKEDQLGLMTTTIKCIPLDEPLEAGVLARVAVSLEAASGEMTFQRFVRYDKADLIGALAKRNEVSKAVQYFLRQTCGTLHELFSEAIAGEIDRISPLRGMRYPGGALDEQDALYRMLSTAMSAADWPICWALLEIYQFGDERHIRDFAAGYARLADLARHDSSADQRMIERLKIICALEFEGEQLRDFLIQLRSNLPADLVEAFKEVFSDHVPPDQDGSTVVEGHADRGSDVEDENADESATSDSSARDHLHMPGLIGTSSSIGEASEAVSRAESQLARGNVAAARAEALAALEHLQRGDWSVWSEPSTGSRRAAEILRHDAKSAGEVVKQYAQLIHRERYTDRWRRAEYLIEQLAPIAAPYERAALVRLVVEHVEIMIGEPRINEGEFRFLEGTGASDASSSLLQLILAAVDHPHRNRREKAAEMLLWLLSGNPQYIRRVGSMAFSMDSANAPDVACGVLDQLSVSDPVGLWGHLALGVDSGYLKLDCRHLGRLSVLKRIAERAAHRGAASAAVAAKHLNSLIFPAKAAADDLLPPQVACPPWARLAENEWQELADAGLATEALAKRATAVIEKVCAPLPVETAIELERLLSEGFRDDPNHSLGRWKARVRFALQVALVPYVSAALLPRVDELLRPYNPARIAHLQVSKVTSPTLAWINALTGGPGAIEPAEGDDIYLDFFDACWDGDRIRSLRLTAFFCSSRGRPTPPPLITTFLSTGTPTASGASAAETCVGVEWRPAFFGSFTPALPSAMLIQMTGARDSDLRRSHWHIGRMSASTGGRVKQEGCSLAIKRKALRLRPDVSLAWVYEIDGRPTGIISQQGRRGHQ